MHCQSFYFSCLEIFVIFLSPVAGISKRAHGPGGLLPIFLSKVLLERSHSHLRIVKLLLYTNNRDRDLWPTKPKVFTIWPFTENMLAPDP